MLAVSILVDVEEPVWIKGIGLFCLTCAVLLAVPPFCYLKRLGKPEKGAAFFFTSRLVDQGPYSLVRHPQYVGYSLLGIGFACLDPHWLTIVLAMSATTAFYLQAFFEERYCMHRFGGEYDVYKKRVPRFNFVLGLFRIVLRRRS